MKEEVKIYIASPLGFSEAGRDFYYGTLIPSIRKLGYEVLDPWEVTAGDKMKKILEMPYGPQKRDALSQVNMELGEENRKKIDKSNGLVAVLDGIDVDSGTAAEVGYGFAKRKPIIGYRGDFRLSSDNEGSIVNLQVEYFIRSSGGTIITEIDKLREELKRVFGSCRSHS